MVVYLVDCNIFRQFFVMDFQDPKRIVSNDFGDPLTFHLVPPLTKFPP